MAAQSILIVDDNPANMKLVRVLLTSEGYDVRTALDAEAALGELISSRPDLILLDIQLPGMDGLELTRKLKSDSATRGIKIVGLPASAIRGDQERIIDPVRDGYLP